MSTYCIDCGTKLDKGVCPNCQEELFIFETQFTQEDYEKMSPAFEQKVIEQSQQPKP